MCNANRALTHSDSSGGSTSPRVKSDVNDCVVLIDRSCSQTFCYVFQFVFCARSLTLIAQRHSVVFSVTNLQVVSLYNKLVRRAKKNMGLFNDHLNISSLFCLIDGICSQ